MVVRAGEVDAERGLAHGRAACDDDHLTGLQALGQVVDVAEAGRHALIDQALLQLVDLVERIVHHRADGRVILAHPAHGHLVDLGLCEVDDILGLRAFGGVAELRDLGAGGDHVAQNGALMDDFGVIRGVGRGGYGGDERMQVVDAADLVEVAVLEQFVGDEHGVHRLRRGEQVDDGLVDGLMLGLVEVGDLDHLADFADGVLAHQHAAQHGHFRIVVMRGHAVEQGVPHRAASPAGHVIAAAAVESARAAAGVVVNVVFPRFLSHDSPV